jgi:membrane associated rhomboid family serine protease/DNA-directed RNA polymerase subunit RPC12/RpoP
LDEPGRIFPHFSKGAGLLFIPYWVDVPYDRKPFANWLILGLILAVFCQQVAVSIKYGFEMAYQQQPKQQGEQTKSDSGDSTKQQNGNDKVEIKHPLESWILHGWNIQGLVGYMWLHGGILHLLGNMWFLWLFGNAVCSKVGNKWFGLMYLGFGFAAAATHLLFDGGPMLGASGAINGVVGMFLVFFPENEVSCLWILFFPYMRRISISSYWIILLWFVYDIWGAMTSGDNVAYFAHVGGFAAGFVLAVFMLERKWVTMEEHERSLLQLVGLHKKQGLDEKISGYGRGWEPWQQEIAEQPPPQTAPEPMPTISLEPEAPPAVHRQTAAQTDVNFGELRSTRSRPEPVEGGRAAVGPQFVKVLCSCGKKVKFPVQYAGRTGRCPQCGEKITIPDAAGGVVTTSAAHGGATDDMIRFSCKCGKKIKVPSKYSGRAAKCPQCHAKIVIP